MFTLIIYTEKGDEIYTGEHFDDIDEDTEASALLREALSSRGYAWLVLTKYILLLLQTFLIMTSSLRNMKIYFK